MEQVPPLKTPNAPEYIEVVKSEIHDEGSSVTFTFNFAKQISEDQIDEFWDNSGRSIQKIIEETLNAKGWNPNDPMIFDMRPTSKDRKTWEVRYMRTDPNTPVSLQ